MPRCDSYLLRWILAGEVEQTGGEKLVIRKPITVHRLRVSSWIFLTRKPLFLPRDESQPARFGSPSSLGLTNGSWARLLHSVTCAPSLPKKSGSLQRHRDVQSCLHLLAYNAFSVKYMSNGAVWVRQGCLELNCMEEKSNMTHVYS